MKNLKKITISVLIILLLQGCNAFKYKKVDTREVPVNAQERARKA